MPEEPINNNPNQPVDVEANEQVNNFNNEAPVQALNTEVPTEAVVGETPAVDTQQFNESVSETPVLDSSDSLNNTEVANNMESNSQPSDGFAANPVVSDQTDQTETAQTPFMAPESLPVQSVGSEPTLPPNPAVPSKNKLLVPILIVGIVIIVLAVAGYFLAKYIF